MRRTTLVIATSAAAAVVGVIAATAGNGGTGGETRSQAPHGMHSTGATSATTLTASDLRNTLNRLLGEHAVLAMNATNLGVTGSKSFPAAAKALDRNSVRGREPQDVHGEAR
jgi:hypothetical protein